MRIAILGTRGIPNHYGGFEQYAELLALYLQKQGWEVVVYNSSRHPYQAAQYQGVILRHVYDPEKKLGTAGQFIYDLGCILQTRREKFDLVYQLGYTSSAIFNFLFPRHTTVVTHMDGLEWKRSKYSGPVRHFLKYAESLVVSKSDFLVADSPVIQDYLKTRYKKPSFYSAYTASIPSRFDKEIPLGLGLTPFGYYLLIARLEPENNVEMILEGYLQSASRKPLVIIGNTNTRFGKYLLGKYKGPGIRFKGAIYDQNLLDNLRHFTRLYFHGHSVGGTNPSLLEAMACGCPVAAHDNAFNRSVLNNNATYFQDAVTVANIFDHPADNMQSAVKHNLARIANDFNTDAVFLPLKHKMIEWAAG